MATRVKASYDASARRAASAERRARILVAARALFLAHGYAATTMSAIARESDVNIDTVYALVGRKPALFRLLVEAAISGVGVAVPAEERDYVRAIQAEESATGKLSIYAESLPAIHARLAPLVDTLKAAGAAEPELAALWEEIAERRRGNMSRLAAELEATGDLAVDPEVAADIIWATNAPELYLLLVEKRGWSHEQYGDWLRDTWVRGLLR